MQHNNQSKVYIDKSLDLKTSGKVALTTLKKALHPRNKHRTRYDFEALIAASSSLSSFVTPNAYGEFSIDFANPQAVIALNKALLIQHYNIRDWDIPAGYLCPPIPGRADYIHYLADLLNKFKLGKDSHSSSVRVLDVGTGANIVYPLIGQREYGWKFVASDIDSVALNNATRILKANIGLQEAIELRPQNESSACFRGIIKPGEIFDLTMCNPPFHGSIIAAETAAIQKLQGLKKNKRNAKPILNFGGQSKELIYPGGEEAFVCNMAVESQLFATNVIWFTTLISKERTLPAVYHALKKVKALQIKTIDMAQGQKKSRFVAWSFINKANQQK